MTLIDQTPTALIGWFIHELERLNPGADLGVVLVGSVARNAATTESDLDLLVVGEREPIVPRGPNKIHVQSMSRNTFLDKLVASDDFVAWCVRYGIPLRPSAVWNEIVQSKAAEVWPDWRQKIDHASRRLLLADDLLRMGDNAAAAEELSYAVSHVGRALLLKANQFPLSRPEMIRQLSDAGFSHLSTTLQGFIFGVVGGVEMRQAIRYGKKLLVYLDRDRFHSYVEARRDANRLKAQQRKNRLASA